MGLRDLVALHSLQREGMPLSLEEALAANRSPLVQALTALLPLDGHAVATCMAWGLEPSGRAAGFIQLQRRRNRSEVDLLYIAPSPCTPEVALIWDRLLAAAASWAAENGVLRLYASLPVDSQEEAVFRRNGYARYATDTVYRLDRLPASETFQRSAQLRPQRERDIWNLQRLYAAVTPLRVQQAEGLIHNGWRLSADGWSDQKWDKSLILEDGESLRAHLGIRRGENGHWIHLVVRPEAIEEAGEMLSHALATVSRWPDRPVYCAIRHYQGGLSSLLAERGFRPVVDRALIVRHMALCVRPALEELALRLQGAAGATYNSVREQDCKSANGAAMLAMMMPLALEWENDRVPDYG